MAAENRFVLISFNVIEGILKDICNYTKQKCSKKVAKLFNNYNLFILLTIITTSTVSSAF